MSVKSDTQNLENQIIEKLKVIQGIRTLQSYRGEADDLVDNPGKIIARFPSLLVTFGGNIYARDGYARGVYTQNFNFTVFVAARSVRNHGQDLRRVGSATDNGAYKIIQDVRSELTDKDLELNDEQNLITLVSELPIVKGVFDAKYIEIYECKFFSILTFNDC